MHLVSEGKNYFMQQNTLWCGRWRGNDKDEERGRFFCSSPIPSCNYCCVWCCCYPHSLTATSPSHLTSPPLIIMAHAGIPLSKIELRLSATHLPNLDVLSKSDPQVCSPLPSPPLLSSLSSSHVFIFLIGLCTYEGEEWSVDGGRTYGGHQ